MSEEASSPVSFSQSDPAVSTIREAPWLVLASATSVCTGIWSAGADWTVRLSVPVLGFLLGNLEGHDSSVKRCPSSYKSMRSALNESKQQRITM